MASPPKGVTIVARKGARAQVTRAAPAVLPVGGATEITIVELSAGGFLAEFPVAPMPGLTMRIDLPGVPPRQARVVRRRGAMIACAFVTELTPDELAQLTG